MMKIAISSDTLVFLLKEDFALLVANEPHFVSRLNEVRAIEEQFMSSVVGAALSA